MTEKTRSSDLPTLAELVVSAERHRHLDNILSYVKALTRRIWIILTVFIVGSVLAVSAAYVLPPVYESTARILVESQQIPEQLAQSTVSQTAAERLRSLPRRTQTNQGDGANNMAHSYLLGAPTARQRLFETIQGLTAGPPSLGPDSTVPLPRPNGVAATRRKPRESY